MSVGKPMGSPGSALSKRLVPGRTIAAGWRRRGSLDPNVPEGRWVLGRWRKLKVMGIHRPQAETGHLQAETVAGDEQNLDADVAARLPAHCALHILGSCRKFGLPVCYGKPLGRPMNS